MLLYFMFLQTIVQCFGHPEIKLEGQDCGSTGEPLFLTPYIESGNIAEARNLARVPLTDRFRIKSYSGFFTVNKTYDSNQFFWYFPVINTSNVNAPIVLWLQGGPGSSSLRGLFRENGPLRVSKKNFKLRKCNWAINHHLIYVDNPVGTGFSFTKHSKGYCVDETQIGEQLYSTIIQFFQLFPELQKHNFFITGQSYAGKYVPALGYTIHKKNDNAKIKINLKALAIGNGLSDPEHQLMYSKYLYQIGLIDWNQEKVFSDAEAKVKDLIKHKQWVKAYNVLSKLLLFADRSNSTFYSYTGFEFIYNFLHSKDYTKTVELETLIQRTDVRKAIHVGNVSFHDGALVREYLKQDMMKSVAPWISKLLDHYNILVYNGQVDIIVPYPLTINYLRNLNFTGSEEYKTAVRNQWYVDGELAGYVKQAGKLTEILLRNAGHYAQLDQPKWALDMITRFTHKKSFTSE